MCSGAQILDLQDASYPREVVLGISLNGSFMSKKYAFECIRLILFMQFISKVSRLYVKGGETKKEYKIRNAKVRISTATFMCHIASATYFIE